MTTEIKTRVSTDIEEIPPIRTEMRATARPLADRHMETIRLTKRLAVSDADGRTVYDTGETPSHSFVTAFIWGLWACFIRTNQRATDIYGTPQTLVRWEQHDTQLLRLNSGMGETRFGPVIGTGTTELSNHDTRLAAQIGHGTGTNQLIHGATTLIGPTEIAGALIITIQRTYTNHSAATVTVSECGIYSIGSEISPPYFHCIIRDLVTPAIRVPVGHTLLLEYRIQTRV